MPKEKGRKIHRRRGATAPANSDLQTHIDSLGLETVGQYQHWCRRHGFNRTLNKNWQDRRQERRVMQRDEGVAKTQADLEHHLETLGLKTADEYVLWCRQQGISPGLDKSESQRRKERELAGQLKSQAALKRAKSQMRHLSETIKRIFAGKADIQALPGSWEKLQAWAQQEDVMLTRKI
jgi:hypothetical protein